MSRQHARGSTSVWGAVVAVTLALTGVVPAMATPARATTETRAQKEPAVSVTARPSRRPVVIGHRGASGYRPEHTLAAYRLAIAMGVDAIEPDLVPTKDHVLVARHENNITDTTDVAGRAEFAGRKRTRTIDGDSQTGWFTEDFTLAELRTLRAKERIPQYRPRNTLYDGRYQVPTFQEVIDLAAAESRRRGRAVWIYPETKHPTYFRSIGLPLEERVAAVLRANGLAGPTAPVYLQSFEPGSLQRLAKLGVRGRKVQLIDETGAPADFVASGDKRTYADLVKPAGLDWLARFVQGVGPSKKWIVPWGPDGKLAKPTSLVADAHARRLLVHPWTFRNENNYLPADFRSSTDPAAYGNAFAEYQLFLKLGVDGLFADNPDTAVEARDAYRG